MRVHNMFIQQCSHLLYFAFDARFPDAFPTVSSKRLPSADTCQNSFFSLFRYRVKKWKEKLANREMGQLVIRRLDFRF